jgi:hypothetical protein
MRRTNAIRERSQAEKHDRSNPFCATHPELSYGSTARISDADVSEPVFRTSQNAGQRAHVSAEHVIVRKKKK